MITDMTKGSPFRILIKFVIPLMFSMVFQQMYNIADSVVAGRFLGVSALAATGAAYPITVLFVAIATGSSIGCSVVIARLFGSGHHTRMRSAVHTAVITLTVLALFLTAVGEWLCRPLMQMIHTPDNIFDPTMVYLRIYIAGLLFLFLYNTATAVFNGLGDSRTPLYFLIFSTTLNVVLDVLFVTSFGMGIEGVAWATLIAQGVSSLLAVGTLIFRLKRIELKHKPVLFERHLLLQMSVIAIPSIFQQSFVSVGVFFVQNLVNGLGSDYVAAFSAAFKISTFGLMVMNSFPGALSSYAAQNIGAGKIDRVRQGTRICILLSMGVIAVLLGGYFFAGDQILGLFLGKNATHTILRIGVHYLLTVAPFYPLVGIKNCCDSILRGGSAMGPFMVTTFADLLLRVSLAYLLLPIWGFDGICYAFPIGWVLGSLLSIVFYQQNVWVPKHLRGKERGAVHHDYCGR